MAVLLRLAAGLYSGFFELVRGSTAANFFILKRVLAPYSFSIAFFMVLVLTKELANAEALV